MSDPQFQALTDTWLYGDPWIRVVGMSQHGGWSSVMRVLEFKERWVARRKTGWRLTPKGKKALFSERKRRGFSSVVQAG